MSSGDDDFDWNDADKGDVVVGHQGQIACYLNGDRDLVVRQERDWWRQDDAWIVIRPENVRQLVRAMLALIEPEKPLALPAPMTQADRAKRYRERKRHEERHAERDAKRDGGILEPAEVQAND